MNIDIQADRLILGKHQFGRVDQRMKIGPVKWPFYDLFWVHQGQVKLDFPDLGVSEFLDAPAGVLIFPETVFAGQAQGEFATASICHFEYDADCETEFCSPGFLTTSQNERLHIQNQLRMAMLLAQKNDPVLLARRQRLLRSILDGFEGRKEPSDTLSFNPANRISAAWDQAADHLEDMRTLSDVARLAGVSESGFRVQHRAVFNGSAGEYLRELRLNKGEELLATTGLPVSEIAQLVGYRHGESFCTAFKKSRSMTPGQCRRWSKPFA